MESQEENGNGQKKNLSITKIANIWALTNPRSKPSKVATIALGMASVIIFNGQETEKVTSHL